MNANNTYNSGDAKHDTNFYAPFMHVVVEHAQRLEVVAVKKKNKFKIAGGLCNSMKNNQHLIISVTFEIQ